jgi:hypothetical protein
MAQVMPHAQWMTMTDGGFTKPRSTQLKAVDTALKNYNTMATPQNLDVLQGALTQWIMKEGPNWKASIRNKKNAVDTLHKQVMGVPKIGRTGESMYAVSISRDESRLIIGKIFGDKELTAKPANRLLLGKMERAGASLNIRTVKKGVQTLAPGRPPVPPRPATGGGGSNVQAFAEQLLGELSPKDILAEVKILAEQIMPGFMAEFVKSILPFAGLITSGGTVIKGTFTTLRATYRVYDASENTSRSLSTAEPAQAFAALIRMLERERNFEATGLAIGTAEFGTKLAGTLLDGGTATTAVAGIVASVAKLAMLIRVVVRDVLEKKAVNELISKGNVDTKIFQACPLAGAYLIVCAPTSVLVNTIFDEFYDHGMMDKVEHAVQTSLTPLKEQATRLIAEHRMYFKGLANAEGKITFHT